VGSLSGASHGMAIDQDSSNNNQQRYHRDDNVRISCSPVKNISLDFFSLNLAASKMVERGADNYRRICMILHAVGFIPTCT